MSPAPTSPDDGAWLTVARIARAQGLRGELAADLHTDFPQRFTPPCRLWLLRAGVRREFELASCRFHQGRAILGLAGIADRTAAQAWSGAEVQVPAAERLPAPPGSYFLSDLVGCQVFDRRQPVGVVAAVENLGQPAPMLVLAGGELVPFAAEFVVAVDLAARRLELNLPEGLLAINHRDAL